MKNSIFLDNNYIKLIIIVLVFMAGWIIGKNNKSSFVNTLQAETLELSAESPSIEYKRVSAYGNYYLVFTQSNGGIFVIKE